MSICQTIFDGLKDIYSSKWWLMAHWPAQNSFYDDGNAKEELGHTLMLSGQWFGLGIERVEGNGVGHSFIHSLLCHRRKKLIFSRDAGCGLWLGKRFLGKETGGDRECNWPLRIRRWPKIGFI